jgi:hypothetical protein
MKLENIDDKNPKKESCEITKESNKQKVIKLKANGNYKTLEIKPCGFESRIRDVCS